MSIYFVKTRFKLADFNIKHAIIYQVMKNNEQHCCDDVKIDLNKFLQIGSGIGRNLLVVGESPALNGWIKSGRAFYTLDGKIVPTGKNFLINLKQIDQKLELDNISFTEISKCYIGSNRNKLMNCATKTWPHFIGQIEYICPSLMILLGKRTTEIFNKIAETDLTIGDIQKIRISNQLLNILPIYHPSPLNPKRVQNIDFFEINKLKIRKILSE